MSEQIDCRCKRCHCWPCECDDAVSITKSTTLKCGCDIGEYCEKCGGTKDATPMERDREIASRILASEFAEPNGHHAVEGIATILAAEREKEREVLRCICKESRNVKQVGMWDHCPLEGGGHTSFMLLRCECGKITGFPNANLDIALEKGTEETKRALQKLLK